MKQFSLAYKINRPFGIEITFKPEKGAAASITEGELARTAVLNINIDEMAQKTFAQLLGEIAHELVHANQLHNFEELKNMQVSLANIVQAVMAANVKEPLYIHLEDDPELYDAELCEKEGALTQDRVTKLYQQYQQAGAAIIR